MSKYIYPQQNITLTQKKTWGIIGFILSIIGLLTSFVYIIGLIAPLISITICLIQIKRNKTKVATIGLIIGIIALTAAIVFTILGFVFSIIILSFFPATSNEVSDYCAISLPLTCSISSISPLGITLEIKNEANEGIVLKNIEVTNCTSVALSNIIYQGQSTKINLECNIKSGAAFISDIIVKFSSFNDNLEKFSSGKIYGIVS